MPVLERPTIVHRHEEDYWGRYPSGEINWWKTFWRKVVILLVLFGIYLFAALMVRVSTNAEHVRYYTEDYLASFGLDVGEWNQMKLGAAIGGGTSGSLQTSSNFSLFGGSSSTSGRFDPTSTVRLGFTALNGSYILEIPYKKVKFEPQPGVEPAVRVITDGAYLDYRSQHAVGGDFWILKPRHREEEAPIQKTKMWRQAVYVGLPTFLDAHLVRVEFLLTPEQYDAYLGTLQTPKT